MRLQGKKLEAACIEYVVIPRQTGNIVFTCAMVTEAEWEECDKIVPLPTPGKLLKPNGIYEDDLEHPEYLKHQDNWAQKRTSFMILKSLAHTPELEWETVVMTDPATWDNYKIELQEAGLSSPEIGYIIEGVGTANGLNFVKIEEAKKSFLAGLEVVSATK